MNARRLSGPERFVLLCAVVLSCVPCLAQPSRFAPKPLSEDFFGINGLGYLHYRDAKDATRTVTRKLAALKQSAAATDRTDFWWGVVEPQKGYYDWGRTDWLINYYKQNRIAPLPILCYAAPWMQQSPHADQDFADYAEYVFQTVSRYKDRVKCWEIWNEPNIPTFWKPEPNVAHYAALLKTAYDSAKRADPACIVVGAATSMTDVNFLRGLAQAGAINKMDVVSFHPYSHSDGPEQMDLARQIENVRTTMNVLGRPRIPLWITEMGWQADPKKPIELDQQARYLVQSYVIAAAHRVERLYWFNLQDWTENGKLEGWGLITADFKPKRALTAYRVMKQMLLGSTFTSARVLQDQDGHRFFVSVFQAPGDHVIVVAWTPRKQQAMIPLRHSQITTLLGETRMIEDGQTSVTDSPIYIQDGLMRFLKYPAPAEPENLLTNGSFEDAESTFPYGWNAGMFYGGSDQGEFSIKQGNAKDGNRSAALARTDDAMWNSWPTPAMPGEQYTLQGNIKMTSATGKNYAQILFLGGPGWSWKDGPKSDSQTGSSEEWKPFSITGTVPEDADVVRVNLVSKGNTGEVFFDGLRFTRNEPNPAPRR